MSVPIEVVFVNGGVFTALLIVLTFFLKKWIVGLDERMKDLCQQVKARVPETTCAERRAVILKDLSDVCKGKEDDHKDIWKKLNHHNHTDAGAVFDTSKG